MTTRSRGAAATYRAILLPLDGSELAERAIPVAAGLAEASGALLHVVVVHKWLAAWTPVNPFTMDLDAIEAQAREEKERYLQRVVDGIAREHEATVRPALLEGFTTDQLTRYVASQAIDLVVMTTHGRGGFSRFWLGSVADRLLHALHVPILLCRAGPRDAPVPALPFRTILVGLDGSAFAETALAAAEMLARAAGTEQVQLCMVVEPPHVFFPAVAVTEGAPEGPSEGERREYAAQYLHTLAQGLARRGLSAVEQVQPGDDPPTALLDSAARVEADAIAVSTRGRTGVSRAMMGSVADKILRSASMPVLITRPARRSARLAPAYARAIARGRAADAKGAAAPAR